MVQPVEGGKSGLGLVEKLAVKKRKDAKQEKKNRGGDAFFTLLLSCW